MPIDADAVTEKLRAALRAQAEAERERQGGTHGESEIEAEGITSEHQTE
jgi:hypothetical protein